MMTLLHLTDVTIVAPGGRPLFDGIRMQLGRERVALVGRNGVGKSTLLAVLSGLLRPNSGRVQLCGSDITNVSCRARACRGLARTFQQPELFPLLTVREHLVLAYRSRHARSRLWQDLFLAAQATKGDLSELEYKSARAMDLRSAKEHGMDAYMAEVQR